MCKVRSINNFLATSNGLLQFTMLLVIAAIVHGLVLRFVFAFLSVIHTVSILCV